MTAIEQKFIDWLKDQPLPVDDQVFEENTRQFLQLLKQNLPNDWPNTLQGYMTGVYLLPVFPIRKCNWDEMSIYLIAVRQILLGEIDFFSSLNKKIGAIMDLLFNLFTEVLISVVRKDHCVCNEDKKAVQKGYLNNFIFSKIYWDTCCFVLNDYCFKPKKIQDTIQKYATPGIDMPLISDFSFFGSNLGILKHSKPGDLYFWNMNYGNIKITPLDTLEEESEIPTIAERSPWIPWEFERVWWAIIYLFDVLVNHLLFVNTLISKGEVDCVGHELAYFDHYKKQYQSRIKDFIKDSGLHNPLDDPTLLTIYSEELSKLSIKIGELCLIVLGDKIPFISLHAHQKISALYAKYRPKNQEDKEKILKYAAKKREQNPNVTNYQLAEEIYEELVLAMADLNESMKKNKEPKKSNLILKLGLTGLKGKSKPYTSRTIFNWLRSS
ncbi:hypothetical protein JCM13304A_04730 [Desulfothermus okinawensis JCM 13304]